MPRRRSSLITRRAGRPLWYENFYVRGRRFRGCLGTDDRQEAERLAAEHRAAALATGGATRPAELTLSQALGRYWLERGQHARTADEIKRHGMTLIAGLGGETPLAKLSQERLSAFVAGRRIKRKAGQFVERANASVNREIGHLRSVVRAAEDWSAAVPKLDWRKLWLAEPDNRQTILSAAREADLFAELRADYHPLIRFALATGVRLENALGLTWRQIDFGTRTITFRTKSRRPGGKLHVLPISGPVAAILSLERDHHPEFVFTYVARRNRFEPHSGALQVKGDRYPFSHDGWRKEWARARSAVGLEDLRFHDLRHTFGTRALAASSGNLKTVQRLLGHSDVSTTLRYLKSDVEDLRATMDKMDTGTVAKRRRRSPK